MRHGTSLGSTLQIDTSSESSSLVGSAGEYESTALQRQIAALRLGYEIKDAQIKEQNEKIQEKDDEIRSLRHENDVLCTSVAAKNSRSLGGIFESCLSKSSASYEFVQGVQRQVLELQRSYDIRMKSLVKAAVHDAELELAFVRGSQYFTDLELSHSKRSLERFGLKKLKTLNRVFNAWRMRQSREKQRAMQEEENDLPRPGFEVDPRGLGSALRRLPGNEAMLTTELVTADGQQTAGEKNHRGVGRGSAGLARRRNMFRCRA
jgi:hypothetical protein